MARGLYFDDVIRVLTLQSGSVIKFRYRPKYINDNLENDSLINKKAIIIFSDGDYRTDPNVKEFPIRECEIVKVNESKDSGRIEYYLELKEFIEAELKLDTPLNELPPYKLLTEVSLEGYKQTTWLSVMERLKDSLDEYSSMMHINGIYDEKNKKVNIEYDDKTGTTAYKLKDSKKYYFEYLAHSFNKVDNKKRIEYSIHTSDEIQIFDTYDGLLLTETERIIVPFYVNKLDIPNISRTIELGIKIDGADGVKTKIYANVSKQIGNSIMFGMFSLVFLLSVTYGNQLIKDLSHFGFCESIKLVGCFGAFVISTAYLYHEFNKK